MKRIIVCADGTWNKPDKKDRGIRKPSNVVKVTRGILPTSSTNIPQVVFYDEGVGTHWGLDKYIGGGLGVGLSEKIIKAYQFIVHNYDLSAKDELYFFGFSRGAYTVRSLAGLIDKIGLIPKDHIYFMPEAYSLYKNKADETSTNEFRQEHNCEDIKIKFIGVWDTVGALGIPLSMFNFINKKYQFHDVTLSKCIDNAYQALAIDEKRKPFAPSIWDGTFHDEQTVNQVWFAGVHTNIGGGYQHDGLANIALHWLVNQAKSHGLEFDEKFLSFYKPWYMHELRDSKPWYMRSYNRQIGSKPKGNEGVHKSAVDRINASPPPDEGEYEPENLMDYLDGSKTTIVDE